MRPTVLRAAAQRIRPSAPLFLQKRGEFVTVAFSGSPGATVMGGIPQDREPEFVKAFSTEPDLYDPQPLLMNPSVFKENRKFWPLAQRALQKHIQECPVFSALAAAETKTPYFHIYDLRNPPTVGRIPEVEDILGTVRIENSQIVPGSFEPNSMYRPVTTFGAMLVSKEMAERIAQETEVSE